MKQFYTILFSIISFGLFGQISITKFSMPNVGNTLKTYTTIAVDISLGTIDGPQEWDFSGLAKDAYQETLLMDPTEGTIEIPEATFLIKPNDVVEQYYKKTDESIEEYI